MNFEAEFKICISDLEFNFLFLIGAMKIAVIGLGKWIESGTGIISKLK